MSPIILASDLPLFTDVRNISIRPCYPRQEKLDLAPGEPGAFDERRQTLSTVLYDKTKGTYRAWYIGAPAFNGTLASGHLPAYAESADGIHWTKPDLGLVEFNGSKHNNIISGLRDRMDGLSVLQLEDGTFATPIFDAGVLTMDEITSPLAKKVWPRDTPPQPAFTGMAFSNDGIRWHYSGNGHALIPEKFELGRLYRANGRYYMNGQQGYPFIPHKNRCAVTFESTDLVHWTKCDEYYSVDDGVWDQCHVGIAPAFAVGNTLVGLAGHFHDAPELPEQNFDIDLVYSNDNLTWHRPTPHTPWLRRGSPETWNGLGVRQAQGAAENGDEMAVYFIAVAGNDLSATHIPGIARFKRNRMAFATISVGWDIGNRNLRHASLRTPVWQKNDYSQIMLNCDNFINDGCLKVSLIADDGSPIPEFTADDSYPVATPGLNVPVLWANNAALPERFAVQIDFQGRGLSPDLPRLYSIELAYPC